MTLHSDDSFMMIVMTRSILSACPRPNHPATGPMCPSVQTFQDAFSSVRGVLQRCAVEVCLDVHTTQAR